MSKRTLMDFPRISRTIDAIRADLYGRLDAVQDDYAARGWLPARLNLNKGVLRGLIELTAWGQFQLYTLMQTVLQQAAPYFSAGKWLDIHAQSVELERRQATKARGLVRFRRSPDSLKSSGNVPIPSGRIVRTLPDGTGEVYRYITQEHTVLPAGDAEVAVIVESESYCASANASADMICELVTPVPGITQVTNTADWLISEGADAETDAQLAERYRLQWMANNGCTKYAYMDWALSVPGVSSVAILDQHPRGQGTVDVVVRGSAVLPTEALLARVREAIAPHTPINDDWLVKGPTPVSVSISGELSYVMGDPELLIASAVNRLRALFADKSPYADVTPLQIGQDVPLALLTHVAMGVDGVKSVRWLAVHSAEPTAVVSGSESLREQAALGSFADQHMSRRSERVEDVPVPASGMAVIEGLTITAVQAGEA